MIWPVFLVLLLACAEPKLFHDAALEYAVYVVDHGKHAGLVIRLSDIPPELIPEKADFPGADYLEVGWGEADYYVATEPGLWLTLKAALWPTPSVLHVVGVHGSPADFFAGLKMVRIDLDRRSLERLIRYVHTAFARDRARRARPLRPGLYGESWFYPARGKFHLFHTCNDWIAEGLRQAGLRMGAINPFTSSQLIANVRRLGGIEVKAD